ncbi:hypothetical protein P43SY_002602 [Pythium insidiosum]|uniref:B box-type domain-containing protein n=1 Tax=Pythium insidiosum TaxID=114742 RepID=A0AAD5MA69_PYTIN|nr:hypothetical protein P43SY_002602 [Pythium insidiosum]
MPTPRTPSCLPGSECEQNAAAFACEDCAGALCFRCTDAIHIIPSFASHQITLVRVDDSVSQASELVEASCPESSVPPPPPPLAPALSPRRERAVPCGLVQQFPQFAPATAIEHRLHLPIGTKLFFQADDCGRWSRELLHGTIVSQDLGIRSVASTASTQPSYFYRVLWLRGVEALANGFFRALLMLPAPLWPVEIGCFPSQLGAFRAVLTAEQLARMKLRRERVSSCQPRCDFPSVDVINEILDETEARLGLEFRVRLTPADDKAFVDALAHGQWDFATWMARIGRHADLSEDRVAADEPLTLLDGGAVMPWSPRDRLRFFLLEQHELLLPDAVRLRHVSAIMEQMLFVYVGFAWQRWLKFVQRHRREERRRRHEQAATLIQQWLRRSWKRQREEQQRALLRHGLLSSMDALDLYRRRQAKAAQLYAWMTQQYQAKQRRVLQHWAEQVQLRDPSVQRRLRVPAATTWHPSHGISNLPRLPRVYAHKRADGTVAIDDLKLYKQFRANHAGPTDTSYWVIRHRVLAGTYPAGQAFKDARRIVARADYTTSVLLQEITTFVCLADVEELRSFEQRVDKSWLEERRRLLAGKTAMKAAVLPKKPRLGGGALAALAASAAARDTVAPREEAWLFEQLVRAKHDALRTELTGALAMSQRQVELAQRELDDFNATQQKLAQAAAAAVAMASRSRHAGLAAAAATSAQAAAALSEAEVAAHRETLNNKIALAQQNSRKAQETLATLSAPLAFVHFPIPKDGVPSSRDALTSFVVDLEDRLRRHERLYLFSMQAHGRTGFIAALLLGRLYGLPALDALERVQRLHDCQWALHGVPATRAISSPKASSQIAMVHELLAGYNSGIYAPLVVENIDEGLYSWRMQQRGTPIDKFTTKEGFMVTDRPDAATAELQRRDHDRLQRLAMREATATRLRAERAREQQRRHELQNEDDLGALIRQQETTKKSSEGRDEIDATVPDIEPSGKPSPGHGEVEEDSTTSPTSPGSSRSSRESKSGAQ